MCVLFCIDIITIVVLFLLLVWCFVSLGVCRFGYIVNVALICVPPFSSLFLQGIEAHIPLLPLSRTSLSSLSLAHIPLLSRFLLISHRLLLPLQTTSVRPCGGGRAYILSTQQPVSPSFRSLHVLAFLDGGGFILGLRFFFVHRA